MSHFIPNYESIRFLRIFSQVSQSYWLILTHPRALFYLELDNFTQKCAKIQINKGLEVGVTPHYPFFNLEGFYFFIISVPFQYTVILRKETTEKNIFISKYLVTTVSTVWTITFNAMNKNLQYKII